MSIENDTPYFRMQVRKWDKDVLKAQDGLVKIFEKTGDAEQLRKGFYALRLAYVTQCLTAYSANLKDTKLDAHQHRVQLLQSKFAFYVTRFATDSHRLFPEQQVRNGYMLFRFSRAGNKLVAKLVNDNVEKIFEGPSI